jgi:hypothetical protein
MGGDPFGPVGGPSAAPKGRRAAKPAALSLGFALGEPKEQKNACREETDTNGPGIRCPRGRFTGTCAPGSPWATGFR